MLVLGEGGGAAIQRTSEGATNLLPNSMTTPRTMAHHINRDLGLFRHLTTDHGIRIRRACRSAVELMPATYLLVPSTAGAEGGSRWLFTPARCLCETDDGSPKGRFCQAKQAGCLF